MGVNDISRADIKQGHTFTFRQPVNSPMSMNSSISSFGSPSKSHVKTVKSLFASFGLTPPNKLCKSGSTDALWFSSKYEKKMAALDENIPGSPKLQRTVPLKQSKLITGPFRATQIWNEVIEHLKEEVEVKRRRQLLRNYDNSFTGTDAVDVVLHYLLSSDKDTFSNLSREKAVKLCQTLMDKNVFKPVGCKSGDTTRCPFEDSNGKLYYFVGEHCNKENSESDDEAEGRDELCERVMDTDDTHMSYTDIKDTQRTSKRKQFESSQRSNKRQRMCSTSTESLTDETISNERVQDIWKEVALCQLLTIVELSFLDGVLNVDEEKEKCAKKLLKPNHTSGVISNIVAKRWSLTCTASSVSHSDPFMRAALECIAHIPRGVSKFDTDFTKASDPVTKRQAYNMICEHYAMRQDSLFPDRFLDLNLAIMKHVLLDREDTALQAMQLNMILLQDRQKDELRRLLKFMLATVEDNELVLDSQLDNESIVLTQFTDCIVKHKCLDLNMASILVTFLVHQVELIFTVPQGFREKVDSRIHENRDGVVTAPEETLFCRQVTTSEYQRQTEECTNNGLVLMMNVIIDNPKMALKEKKQRLQQFRKFYPYIYTKHFSGMV